MTDAHLLLSMAISLALTLAIELALAALLRRELALTALANLMTNPPLVALCLTARYYAPMIFPWLVAALELVAVAAEGAVYRRYSGMSRPFLFSLGANALSFAIGSLL